MDRLTGAQGQHRRTPSAASCERLLQLSIDDECPAPLIARPPTILPQRLDDRTRALVRLGALVATGAGPTSYQRHVAIALGAGATGEDVVETLVAVAPTVGLANVVSATVGLALGLGYDIDAALECLDEPLQRPV